MDWLCNRSAFKSGRPAIALGDINRGIRLGGVGQRLIRERVVDYLLFAHGCGQLGLRFFQICLCPDHGQIRLGNQHLCKLDIQRGPQLTLRKGGKLVERYLAVIQDGLRCPADTLRRLRGKIGALDVQQSRLANAFFSLGQRPVPDNVRSGRGSEYARNP